MSISYLPEYVGPTISKLSINAITEQQLGVHLYKQTTLISYLDKKNSWTMSDLTYIYIHISIYIYTSPLTNRLQLLRDMSPLIDKIAHCGYRESWTWTSGTYNIVKLEHQWILAAVNCCHYSRYSYLPQLDQLQRGNGSSYNFLDRSGMERGTFWNIWVYCFTPGVFLVIIVIITVIYIIVVIIIAIIIVVIIIIIFIIIIIIWES